jgi:hypothetical protein
MEVSDQTEASAALTLVEETPVPVGFQIVDKISLFSVEYLFNPQKSNGCHFRVVDCRVT